MSTPAVPTPQPSRTPPAISAVAKTASGSPAAHTGPTPERIMQFAWGYVPPLAIEAAIRNRVFDSLDAHGAMSVAELQQTTGASRRGLHAVCNVLAGLGLLAKDGDGRYENTPESSTFLVSGKPSYQGGMLRHASRDLMPQFLQLPQIMASGRPAQALASPEEGEEFFRNFVADIFPLSYPAAQALARHLNLQALNRPVSVLDLAAGSGVWGIALAQSAPMVHVTAVDWPGVLPVTQEMVAKFDLTGRFQFEPGDLHEAEFGAAHSVATLGHILHTEGAGRSRALLAKTFAALAPGGTIAIAEFLVNPDRTGPVNGLIFAVNMLVNSEAGDTFSFEEISSWLAEAGFINPRTLDSPGPSPLILATRPA